MEMDKYLDVFLDESQEHLQTMNDGLLQLENSPEDTTIVSEIFRAAHTLKGMSATMGFESLANLTHQSENVLDEIRNDRLAVSSSVVDVLFESADHLEEMVASITDGGDGKRDVQATVSRLKKLLAGEEIAASDVTVHSHPGAKLEINEYEKSVITQSRQQGFDAFNVHITLNESCVLKAARVFMVFEILEACGEVIKSVPTVAQLEEEAFEFDFSVILITKENQNDIAENIKKVSEIEKIEVGAFHKSELNSAAKSMSDQPKQEEKQKTDDNKTRKKTAKKGKTLRVNIERLDRLMNLFEEMVIERGRLEQISRNLEHADLTDSVEKISRVSSDLQEMMLKLRMVPIDQVFNRFPKMVRGLAKELQKDVQFTVSGGETELDRTVVDEIGDPLVHLLRNSIDHGVESREIRQANGKPSEGVIKLDAFYAGNRVFIEINDDGAGINKEKVSARAIDRAIISEEEAEQLTDKEVYGLLFSSGFSTAEVVSDISGRGVGLDVVKNKIESLGGTVSVDSELGKGTTFSIQLPLTLSIVATMLVTLKKEIYAIPLSSIDEIAVINQNDILRAHNQNMVEFRGRLIPLIDLKQVFSLTQHVDDETYYSIVIVHKGDKMSALIVDSFIGQQEVVLKPLGNYLTDIFAISGATILGDGKVALILDCNALIK